MIQDGTITIKQRKQRSDTGTKRPRKGKGKVTEVDGEPEDTDGDERPPKRRVVSAVEVVDSDQD
jgi:hypothetical protein